MQGVTLVVALAGSILIIVFRPLRALVVYFALVFFYPSYLTVAIGTVDFGPTRIAVALLLIKLLGNPGLRKKFVWQRLDSLVTAAIIIHVAIQLIAQPTSETLINRAGYVVDTWLAYLAVRMCITSRGELITVMKWIGIFLLPLAILGLVEAFTGWQPYLPLTQYCPWKPEIRLTEPRSGLSRAIGPFAHPIMFGLSFVVFLPLVYLLRHERGSWRPLAYFLSLAAIAGSLSSMSSGPWMVTITTVFWLALERHRHLVKPLLISFVIGCVLVGIMSNRPFYHVIASYADPIGGSGWHRCKLIDCAIADFGQWYLVGYGGKDPGWGQFLGLDHTDVTNEFILAGVKYGILGVAALVAVLVAAFSGLIRLLRSTRDSGLQSLAWALCTSLVAMIFAFMSVSIFGQMSSLFYCLLGMAGSAACFSAAGPLCSDVKHVHQARLMRDEIAEALVQRY